MHSLHCYDFWKKFLTKVEFKCISHQWKVSAMNSVHAELILDEGEPRYKIMDVIGEILIQILI